MMLLSEHGARFVIDLDVFNIQVGVFFADEERVNTLQMIGVDPAPTDPGAYGSAHLDIGPDGYGWFSLVITDETTIGTRAHECVHIADFVMERLGIPTDANNTEVRAYMVGHLVDQLEVKLAEARNIQ